MDANRRANVVLVFSCIVGGREPPGGDSGCGTNLDLNQFRLDLGTYAFALE